MATGPQQKRKELREKRLKAEAAAKSGDRRQNLAKIVGAAAFVAVVAIVVAIVALSSGGDDPDTNKDPSSVDKMLAGIPQNGTVLGDPKAKVTLLEFGDLQCPVCKQYAEQILPDVISGPIKDGTANFDFQNWAILGEDSTTAAKAMLSAAEQDKGWTFLENFYANQGVENTGYVTDDFIADIAEKSAIPDMDKFEADRTDPKWDDELLNIDEQANQEGFTGTPSFAIRGADGKLTVVDDTQSADAIIKAINQAAKQ